MSFKDFPLKNLIFRQSNARTLRTRSLAILSLLLITTISVQAQSPITFQNTLSSFYEYGVSIFYGASRATSSAKSEAAATQQTSERCAGNMTAPFSVEADFSLESNPCGVFSYGFIAANDVNSTFALYPPAAADTQIGSLKRGSRDDANDLLDLRPVSSGERAVVRFTMPANNKGAFAVNGRFVGLGSSEAAMNAAIVRRTNGIDTTLFAAELKGANDAKEFDFAIADLAEGDIIDFIVDGGDGNNSVGLAANIGRQAVVAPEIVFAIANTVPQSLVQFDASTPATVTTIGDITGLGQNETLVGIDFRPRNRVLYGVSQDSTNTGRLYTINTTTAVATLVGTLTSGGTPIVLDGTEFGVDFNPVPDLLRVISSNGQNLRINPNNGVTIVDDALNPADAGGTQRTGVTGAAYTNNVAGATTTTLYDIDTINDTLVIQNPPNNGALNLVGPLGVNVNAINGFDISGTTGVAYAAVLTGSSTASDLYTIDLTTGTASRVARIDTALTIRGLSAAPIGGVGNDATPPTVTINQAANQPDPTNVSPVNFTVVFSEMVTGFDSADVILGGTANPMTANVTPGSGTTYNVAVSGMTQNGTVTATVNANGAMDAGGNSNTASTSNDNTVSFFFTPGIVTRVRDNVTFTTIQAAIDDAGTTTGDTLQASAGIYNERVNVNKSVTIRGAQAGNLAKSRTNSLAESIIVVDNSGTPSFNLLADDVTINGFDFDINRTFPSGTPNGTDKPLGIILGNEITGAFADGYQNISVLFNRMIYAEANVDTPGEGNRGGIRLATTDNLLIEGNYLAGFPGQSVINSDGSTNFIFRNNDTFNSTFSSVSLQANFRREQPNRRHINALIENNRIDRDDAVLFLIDGGTIRNNTFTGGQLGAGQIYLGGANNNVQITGNTMAVSRLQGIVSFTPGFGNPISFFDQNSNISIVSNTLSRIISPAANGINSATTGSFAMIDFRGTGGTNTIANNTLTFTGAGLPAGNNSSFAIRLRGSASGNFNIVGNTLDGNNIAATGTSSPQVSGLYITSNQAAIAGSATGDAGAFPASSVVNVNCNTFTEFQNGIVVSNSNGTIGGLANGDNININANNLIANTAFGINNGGTSATIDGENNYWNSATGPTSAQNPGGTGDPVSENVDFVPFLTAPSMCAPINTVPVAQTINQDTTLTFSGANQVSIADLDAGSSPVTITLSVTNGTLSLSQVAGLTFAAGDGTNDATMTFSGTLAAVNAALNGLTFTPNAGFVGTSTLTITSSSTGSPGVGGGTQSDTDTVTINVLDAIVPTVTINQVPPPAQTDPTSTSPINFTAVFSESVANFATGDVTVTGSAFGPGSTPVAVVTGSGTTYNIAVSGMTRSGMVTVTIAAGVATDTQGNPNAVSTSTDNTVFFNFVVGTPVNNTESVNPTNVTAPPGAPPQFFFQQEGATGSGAFVTGPATPPLGIGSAQLTIDSTGREILATRRYAGTRLADITALQYSAYTNRTDGLTITLQFDVDYDLSDANGAFQSRLVYEPAAQAIPVTANTWQAFDTLAGRFYSSSTSSSNPGFAAGCTQAAPCTRQQLLAAFPNVGILGGPGASFPGAVYLRAGGPFAGGMVANTDNLVVGVNGNTTAFDFEPSPPTVSISDATAVTEGNAGQTTATFTITQSVVSQLDTTVTVNTANGTATTADSDYQPIVNQTFTIPAGQTTATASVVVNINGDTNVEGNETFNVNLSNALNAAIADGQGVGTINNDDVFVSFSSATYGVGEAAGTATITVTRNGVTPNAVTVNYATGSGSGDGGAACTAGIDFINTNGTLSFASNETSKTFTVTICNDLLSENPETVNLTLSGVTGGATLGTAAATLTITDNDGGGPVSISGVITQDSPTGAGLNGVTVTLTGTNVPANTTTTTMTINGVDGSYSFTGLTGNATSPNNYLVTPSLAGRVFDPTERSYVNLGMNVTNANFAAFNTGAVPRNLRVVTTSQSTINSTVEVPIVLDSLGTENALSFSLNYNPAFLSNPTVVCGSDAPGCQVSSNNVGGTLGIVFTRDDDVNNNPTAFTAGTGRQVVRVTFTATPVTTPVPSPSATYSTPITFGDSPTARDVNDVEGNSVPTNYVNGSVIFAQGIEGDVAPRFNGDGNLSGNDVTVLRQFVNGSLIPDPTTNEFARADVAPAGNKGNGSLTSADVTVLRGYIQNSVRTPVGGPNQPTTGAQTALSVFEKEAGVSRNIVAAAGDVRVVSVNSTAGATNVSVPIELDSGGNENGVTISVQFNTSRLTFVSATPGADVASQSGTTFDVNRTQLAAGRVGVALTLDINQTFTPGPKRVIVLTFNVAANATTSAITFVNNPLNSEINNTTGDTLPATFRAGNVSIGSATAATVSVGGRVTDGKAGSPLKNARVSFTDQSGTTRTATTNSFGYYRIREIPAGGTYVVQITARRFNFAAQTVTINSETDSLDFNIAP